MDAKENGNQPAFAGGMNQDADYSRLYCYAINDGLTKRELFAAMAMQGMAASEAWSENFDRSKPIYLEEVAEVAVNAADALLVALAKQPTPSNL